MTSIPRHKHMTTVRSFLKDSSMCIWIAMKKLIHQVLDRNVGKALILHDIRKQCKLQRRIFLEVGVDVISFLVTCDVTKDSIHSFIGQSFVKTSAPFGCFAQRPTRRTLMWVIPSLHNSKPNSSTKFGMCG